jgi:hypothetical protein
VRIRRILPPLLAAVLVLASAGPASAGGNWLEFRRDTPTGPGARFGPWSGLNVGMAVIAHTSIYVRNDNIVDRLRNETFYAWLSPGEEGYERDGGLPADAVRLSPFRIRWENDQFATVHAPFTVPAVASGEYEVLVCNDPCTLSGFGEFVQTWITVFQTPTERRLFELASERRMRAWTLDRRVRELEGDLAGLEVRLDTALAEIENLRRAADVPRPTSLADDAPIVQVRSEPEASVTWWVALLAAFIGLGAGLVARRRRVPAMVVPDTVPDDLLAGEAREPSLPR